jgi:hypothetical protein
MYDGNPWLLFIKAITATWLLAFCIFLVHHYDGKLFPVVDAPRTEIHNFRADPDYSNASLFDGSFVKIRDCTFTDLTWYYGTEERSVSVRVEFTEKPIIRDAGLHQANNWRVFLDEENIMNNSYAFAYHDCYGGWLWETKTLFYIGSKK